MDHEKMIEDLKAAILRTQAELLKMRERIEALENEAKRQTSPA